MRAWILVAFLPVLTLSCQAQTRKSDADLQILQQKLEEAVRQANQLTATIESLRSELARLKEASGPKAGRAASGHAQPEKPFTVSEGAPEAANERNADTVLKERIIAPKQGAGERAEPLTAKPELFIQSRYSAAPIPGSAAAFRPNVRLSRIETRWSGRVADRLGAGLEIQFQPALEGTPEELVNDAFLEVYLNGHATLRAGQFIKPFGFEIQQSSSVRESPERGMFAGYFFPGQRDRGVLLLGNLDFLRAGALRNVQYFLGAFNGNRFFNDNNRQLNYLLHIRKILGRPALAIGASAQIGKQLLPPGTTGNNNERVFGLDLQYAAGRFGLRGEIVTGNTPSTLLGIRPEFAPRFRPGAHSSGGYLFLNYRIARTNNLYMRYDQFNSDLVTGKNVRALNVGYFRDVGRVSRLSIDYQLKNRPSFNDDAVNGRLQITMGVVVPRELERETPGQTGRAGKRQ